MPTDRDGICISREDIETDDSLEEVIMESVPPARPVRQRMVGLSGEDLRARVMPPQINEFTCVRCFLIHHRSQLAGVGDNGMICMECS